MSAPKPLNPKDSVGVRKAPASVVPQGVVAELGLAMLEGARKYGRHNYRAAGIVASVNFDAARGHIDAWWEGEDLDPDSQLSHVIKAIAALTVLRDGMMQGNWIDDRPPPTPEEFRPRSKAFNAKASAIIDRHPDAVPAFTARPGGGAWHGFRELVFGASRTIAFTMAGLYANEVWLDEVDEDPVEPGACPEAVAAPPEVPAPRAFKVGDRVRITAEAVSGEVVHDDGDSEDRAPYQVRDDNGLLGNYDARDLKLVERATA